MIQQILPHHMLTVRLHKLTQRFYRQIRQVILQILPHHMLTVLLHKPMLLITSLIHTYGQQPTLPVHMQTPHLLSLILPVHMLTQRFYRQIHQVIQQIPQHHMRMVLLHRLMLLTTNQTHTYGQQQTPLVLMQMLLSQKQMLRLV